MATNQLPSPAELRQLVRYEPETGKLFWRERDETMFHNVGRCRKAVATAWNRKNAGKEAFCALGTDGYLYGGVNRRRVAAHRVAVAIVSGDYPDAYVDHINGIKTDNRIVNLRCVGAVENNRNRSISKCNTSGKAGVDYLGTREGAGWRARISDHGSCIMLGWYRTRDEAVAAREAAEKILGFHPNHGRPNPLRQTTPSTPTPPLCMSPKLP